MRRLTCLTGVLLAVGVCLQATPQRSRHDFEGHTFRLDLPPGYVLQADQSPRQGLKTFGFSSDLRQDGSRGLIQVSLLDLSGAPAGGEGHLGEIRGSDDQGCQRATQPLGTEGERGKDRRRTGKRIEWTGSVEPGFGRPAVDMRGVMIIGLKSTIGFSLHTQDRAAFADTTLPLCEQALQTFTLSLRR